MADTEKNSQRSGKRKHTEKAGGKSSSLSKRKKPLAETIIGDNDGQKKGKHRHDKIKKNAATSSKRRKHSYTRTPTAEVATMDEEDLDEHTRLLSSVTGKMERLPLLHKDGRQKGEEEEKEEEEGKAIEPTAGVDHAESNGGVGKDAAAQYLLLWNLQRDQWTFKKKTQYWLLQNMFDKKKVSSLMESAQKCLYCLGPV
jgi:hypothetical protein